MLNLEQKVSAKLKVKVTVYFVTTVFSFDLNIGSTNCRIKLKIDRLNPMH